MGLLFCSKERVKDRTVQRPKCKGIDRKILVYQSQGTHTYVQVAQEGKGMGQREGGKERERD